MMNWNGACDSYTGEEMFKGFWMGKTEETTWKAKTFKGR
jgi:hypothetical protein